MTDVGKWRVRNGLTQVDAALLLGVSQPYLSLLERGVRPLTATLRDRMKLAGGQTERKCSDDVFAGQLSRLGYPGFAHVAKSRSRPRPGGLLMAVLARREADARVVEALPWLAATFQSQLDFCGLVRQAKLQNMQNRLAFVLAVAGVHAPGGRWALDELEQARLVHEDTLCWDSMPQATREWMRANRSRLAGHWNLLTMLRPEDTQLAA